MAEENELLRSKHAFGSVANLDSAISQGKVDAYDILFLKDENDQAKIGWIDKNGNKVIVEDKKQVTTVTELPTSGDAETIYLHGSNAYIWVNDSFVPLTGESTGITETIVDEKIATAKTEVIAEAKTYADTQLANAISIVEF